MAAWRRRVPPTELRFVLCSGNEHNRGGSDAAGKGRSIYGGQAKSVAEKDLPPEVAGAAPTVCIE